LGKVFHNLVASTASEADEIKRKRARNKVFQNFECLFEHEQMGELENILAVKLIDDKKFDKALEFFGIETGGNNNKTQNADKDKQICDLFTGAVPSKKDNDKDDKIVELFSAGISQNNNPIVTGNNNVNKGQPVVNNIFNTMSKHNSRSNSANVVVIANKDNIATGEDKIAGVFIEMVKNIAANGDNDMNRPEEPESVNQLDIVLEDLMQENNHANASNGLKVGAIFTSEAHNDYNSENPSRRDN
jgi:hypothetical protein